MQCSRKRTARGIKKKSNRNRSDCSGRWIGRIRDRKLIYHGIQWLIHLSVAHNTRNSIINSLGRREVWFNYCCQRVTRRLSRWLIHSYSISLSSIFLLAFYTMYFRQLIISSPTGRASSRLSFNSTAFVSFFRRKRGYRNSAWNAFRNDKRLSFSREDLSFFYLLRFDRCRIFQSRGLFRLIGSTRNSQF